LFGLALVLAALSAPVFAQGAIYSWRDERGNLVFSNRPRDGAAPVGTSMPRPSSIPLPRAVPRDPRRMYDDVIVEHSRMHNIRPDLVRAVVQVESAFNPYAVSPKGAQGLMQLMPATARELGVRNAFNPIDNIRGGTMYLRQLLDRYSGDEMLALAAYNAGPNAVDRYGVRVPPFRETRDYVKKINSLAGEALRTPATRIYKAADVTADGRVIPKYTDKKPQ
jgi:soluble lytic murein transglycosylase-like protein